MILFGYLDECQIYSILKANDMANFWIRHRNGDHFEATNYLVRLDGEPIERQDGTKIPFEFSVDLTGYGEGRLRYSLENNESESWNGLVSISFQIIFTNSRNSPRLPEIEIITGDVTKEPLSLSVRIRSFKPTKYFQNYVDILRNESPLLFALEGEIDEKRSKFANWDKRKIIYSNDRCSLYSKYESIGEGE